MSVWELILMTSESCKSGAIRLEIRQLGHVPSMKNNKMLTRGRLITNPQRQRWMDLATQSIESQLFSAIRINGEETLTGQELRSLIAWSKQFDDARTWVPSLHIESSDCDKGEEGAEIIIERL